MINIRGYAGGGASRIKPTLKTWRPQHYSAKSEIDLNLKTLRARAADLVKNSAVGSAIVETLTAGVIGSGLKLFPRPDALTLGLSVEEARTWSRRVKAEFNLWAGEAMSCDFLKRNTFAELQAIVFRSYLTEGDSFVLFKRRQSARERPYTLRLQAVEANRISTPNLPDSGVEVSRGNNRIVNGIEVDGSGALIAIWVANRLMEPNDIGGALEWQRVLWRGQRTGRENILHICNDLRPAQYRGVPVLTPIIESLKQVSRYADAELSAAIVRSFFSVFFIQPANNHTFNEMLDEELDVSEYKLGSATIAALPRGVDVKAIDAGNTQSTFDQFSLHFLTQIAAAVNLPREVILKAFNSSYSASRAALLQAEGEFRIRRARFITDFLRPIYEQFLLEAVSLGRVDAPGFFDEPLIRQAWSAADWYAERTNAIDPLKSAQGMKLALEAGLTTYRKELAESAGLDFDDVIEQLKQERSLLREVNNGDL